MSTPLKHPSRTSAVLACFSVCALVLGGCSAAAAVRTVRAAGAVETARGADASRLAPYELAAAEAYLAKAREEASQAQYVDAVRFARAAEQQANRAVEVARAGGEEAPQ